MITNKAANKWMSIAQSDFRDAQALLEQGERFQKLIVFCAQQAVEKAIKAYLSQNNKRFQKTHDIESLVKLIEKFNSKLSDKLLETPKLTKYATAYRYPDSHEVEPTFKMTQEAVEIAKNAMEVLTEELG